MPEHPADPSAGLAPHLTPDATPSPGPQTLLVGTVLSVRQLVHTLSAAAHSPPAIGPDASPKLVGCLLTTDQRDTPGGSDNLPCPRLGGTNTLDELGRPGGALPRVDQVLVSLPVAMADTIAEVSTTLERSGLRWRFMPTLSDQLAGRSAGLPGVSGALARPIDPTQLLSRVPKPLDEEAIVSCLGGKTVLITGAGGSIGSELAMSVSRFGPSRLVLVERSENALFEIDREIARVFPELPRRAMLADVTHAQRMLDVFEEIRPEVVFHAAAHKHVPMMEDHPAEAIENNLYGTRHVAEAAHRYGAERFVMISTDKAVNPSSVMGASKRLAELLIRRLDSESETIFSMVRFGNVLGSACSVLPIWSKQLRQGGPITVTHPAMTRYFMTIPEAAGLVLQAGALSHGGEVFLLDMGRPINILQLAERFVRLQGFEPNVDVQIKLTGVRPGEKLFEVLAYDSEDMTPTEHDSIRIWRTDAPDVAQMRQTLQRFDRLRGAAPHWRGVKPAAVVAALRSAVPEMVHAAAG